MPFQEIGESRVYGLAVTFGMESRITHGGYPMQEQEIRVDNGRRQGTTCLN